MSLSESGLLDVASSSKTNGQSTTAIANGNGASAGVEADAAMTEEEAALYDRQLRLWGSVAQSRIRQARIIMAPFHGGVAVETAKNLILAGVKELILVDDGDVNAFNLTSGFVWREKDIGQKLVEAGHPRLSSLNPHVTITTIVKPPTLDTIRSLVTERHSSTSPITSVIYTSSNPFAPHSLPQTHLEELNKLCRQPSPDNSSPSIHFHLASSQGFDGYIFQDLGPSHQFLVNKKNTTRDSKNAVVEKIWSQLWEMSFVTFGEMMDDRTWSQGKNLVKGKRAMRDSENLWGTWAIWELLNTSKVAAAADVTPALLLETITSLLDTRGFNATTQLYPHLSPSAEAWASSFLLHALPAHPTQPADFAPTTAVLGGILSQEVLNAVGGRETPKVANWLCWQGLRGAAPVFRIGGVKEKLAVEGSKDEVKTGNGEAKAEL